MVLEYIDDEGKRRRETIRREKSSCCRPIVLILLNGRRFRGAGRERSVTNETGRLCLVLRTLPTQAVRVVAAEADLLATAEKVSEQFNNSESLRTCTACGYCSHGARPG